jgi:predicted nucleic acid-binding protein
MIVVSDASPLLALAQANCLPILKALFGRILIPNAVCRETVEQCPVANQRQRIRTAIGESIGLRAPQEAHGFARKLGEGERGVLALALERHADLLLMDDRKARNQAAALGFQCAYTTDVMRLAEKRGIIASAAEVVKGLQDARIFLPIGGTQRSGAH